MIGMESEFEEYINDVGELKTGKLVLGGSSLYSLWVIPPIMGRFSKQYPQIQLELKEETTANLCQMLQNGEVDFMLDNCELGEELFERQLFQKEYLMLAVPKQFHVNDTLRSFRIGVEEIRNLSFLEAQVPEVDLGLFAKEPFILLKPENDTRMRAMDLCKQYGFEPNIVFELDQQMTSYNITCSGMGISFISNTLISKVPESSEVVYYKLGGKSSCRNLYFYWKKHRYLSRVMEEFLSLMNK